MFKAHVGRLGTRIRIRFADPIRRSDGASGAQILERARADIEATLRRWRGEPAARADT